MNISRFLVRAAKAAPDWPAIIQGGRVIATYGALLHRANCMAGNLIARRELSRGDRVALVMKNAPEYIECLYACWIAGLTVVPVNAKLSALEIAFILENSITKIAFVTADLSATVSDAAKQSALPVEVIETGTADYRALLVDTVVMPTDTDPLDIAWLFYTSGTTGRPKGAMLSHRNLNTMSLSYFVNVDTISRTDSLLHLAPMSHGSGLYILPHAAAMATNVIPESDHFDPDEAFSLIHRSPGASFFAAPTMLHRMLHAPAAGSTDTRNLKTMVSGGGPLYAEDIKALLGCFGSKLAQIYGQGESPMTITSISKSMYADIEHPQYEDLLLSVGYPQCSVEVCTERADGAVCSAGEIGEVLVRGDTVMQGYWNAPGATAETLRGGWLHTGDLGVFDAAGLLTLKDRAKDLIITGGSNVYPREVEEILLLHPGVMEAAVIGFPNREWGEEIVAFVVRKPDAANADESTLDALCLHHIARFKRPKIYRFVGSLAKNNYGKVLKSELRNREKEYRAVS